MSGEECAYCSGDRCPCSCPSDCGARASDYGVVCAKAPGPVRADWLASMGSLYSPEEIERVRNGPA